MLLPFVALLSADASTAAPPTTAPEIVIVTASPLADSADALSQGVSIVPRAEVLNGSISGGIGEAISGQPGVRATFYGTNASRPIIRGLGEDRIRLLLNGLAGIDASTISPDHAPAIDGLDADRVEVLKGPAALRFGGNAVGGVVNVVDGRLPDALPKKPIDGAFFYGTSSAENSNAAAFQMRATTGKYLARIDGFARSSQDYDIPSFRQTGALRVITGDDVKGVAENTRGDIWALGASAARITDRSNLAVSVRKTESNYGIPGEEAFIALKQTRFDARAIVNDLGFIDALTVSATGGDYTHSEIEFGGEVGTVFTNKGYEGRVEARHKPLGDFEGLWGLQFGSSDFAAIGAEAFIAPVTIKQTGLFGFERYDGGIWGGEAGVRFEHRGYDGVAGKRDFDLTSASASAFVKPITGLRLSLSVGRTQRAPTEVELFADGPHAATVAFERGDRNLKIETATTIEAGAHWEIGALHAHLDIWQASFDGFVNFSPTGEIEDDLPLFTTSQRDATLKGAEVAVAGTIWSGADWSILGDLSYDFVDGRYDDGDFIARIPPSLVTLGVEAKHAKLGLRGEVQMLGKQDQIAAFESPTASATTYNVRATWRPLGGQPDLILTLEGRNLSDEEVREHTSFLKDQLPKPGRSLRLSLQTRF
jgi:iron complex outermembrane recepter protein